MTVNNKRVFYVKYLAHHLYADILKARPDVRLDRLENETPEEIFAPVLREAHAYQVGAARDDRLSGLKRSELAILGALVVVTAAAGVTRYAHSVSRVVAFVFATLALAGMAWVVALATEQVGERLGPAATGLMQSTVGNLPEFFVVIFALNAGQRVVAETAILGSILALTPFSATLVQGVIFLLAYALGLGLPFLLVGILVDRVAVAHNQVAVWG